MPLNKSPPRFWINWLLVVSAGVVAFGMLLVLCPALARQGFSLLMYPTTDHIDSFGTEQVRYISLLHAVIGGVLIGWGTSLFYATRTLVTSGDSAGWYFIFLSVVAWFVPDTGYSLLSGFWPNALLNTVFFTLFAVPLWAMRSAAKRG